jgi:hypothetical protein
MILFPSALLIVVLLGVLALAILIAPLWLIWKAFARPRTMVLRETRREQRAGVRTEVVKRREVQPRCALLSDCAVPANRTSPRQQVQRDHPGSKLSFTSGTAIKRITAGVKARRWLFSAKAFDLLAGPSPSG